MSAEVSAEESRLGRMTSFIVMDILDRAVELEKQGVGVIHMEVGEPDFEPSNCINKALQGAVDQKKTHYTHSLGTIRLREALVDFYKSEYGVKIDKDQIVVTSGSSPALLMALMVVADGGGSVVTTNPGYACYKNLILAAGMDPIFVSVRGEDGYQPMASDVRKCMGSDTRAIIINSPMNPTGTLVSAEVMKGLSGLGLPIISDEIYHGLVYSGRAHTILEYTSDAIVVNGFSKRFAMTGLRLGYIIAPRRYMERLHVLQQNLFICAPSVSQEAAVEALLNPESAMDVRLRNNLYNERRLYLLDELRRIGFGIEAVPEGAFYIYVNASKFCQNSYDFCFEVLEKAHVGITPGIDFGSNGMQYVRFSYANSLENIKEAMRRLDSYLNKK